MEGSIKEVHKLLENLKKNFQCTICLDLLSQPVSTKCNHQFCKECFNELLQNRKNKKNANCPLCNTKVTKRSLQITNPMLVDMVSSARNLCNAADEDLGVLGMSPLLSQRHKSSCKKKRKDSKQRTSLVFVDAKKNIISRDRSTLDFLGTPGVKMDGKIKEQTSGEVHEHATSSKKKSSNETTSRFTRSSIQTLCDEETASHIITPTPMITTVNGKKRITKRTSVSTKRKSPEKLSTCTVPTTNNENNIEKHSKTSSCNSPRPRNKRRRRLANSSSMEEHDTSTRVSQDVSQDFVQPSLSSGPSSIELLPRAHKCSTRDPCNEVSSQTIDVTEELNISHVDKHSHYTVHSPRKGASAMNCSSTKKPHCDPENNNRNIEHSEWDSTKDGTSKQIFDEKEMHDTTITNSMSETDKSSLNKQEINSQNLDDSKTQSIDLTADADDNEQVNDRKNDDSCLLQKTSQQVDTTKTQNNYHRAACTPPRLNDKEKFKLLWESFESPNQDRRMFSNLAFSSKRKQYTSKLTPKKLTDSLPRVEGLEQAGNRRRKKSIEKADSLPRVKETDKVDILPTKIDPINAELPKSSKIDTLVIMYDGDDTEQKNDDVRSSAHAQCYQKQQHRQQSCDNSIGNDSIVSYELNRQHRFGSHSEESVIPPTPPLKCLKSTRVHLSTSTIHKTFCYPGIKKPLSTVDTLKVSPSKLDRINSKSELTKKRNDASNEVDRLSNNTVKVATGCDKDDFALSGKIRGGFTDDYKLSTDTKGLKRDKLKNDLLGIPITDSDKQLSEMNDVEIKIHDEMMVNDGDRVDDDNGDINNPRVAMQETENLEEEKSDQLELGDFDDDEIDVYTNDKISAIRKSTEEQTILNLVEEEEFSPVDEILFLEPTKQQEIVSECREDHLESLDAITVPSNALDDEEIVDFVAERSSIGEVLDLSTIPSKSKCSLQPIIHNKSTILPLCSDSFVDIDLFEGEATTTAMETDTLVTSSKSKPGDINDIHLEEVEEDDVIEKPRNKRKQHHQQAKRTIESPDNDHVRYDDGGFKSNSESSDDEMYMKPALSLNKSMNGDSKKTNDCNQLQASLRAKNPSTATTTITPERLKILKEKLTSPIEGIEVIDDDEKDDTTPKPCSKNTAAVSEARESPSHNLQKEKESSSQKRFEERKSSSYKPNETRESTNPTKSPRLSEQLLDVTPLKPPSFRELSPITPADKIIPIKQSTALIGQQTSKQKSEMNPPAPFSNTRRPFPVSGKNDEMTRRLGVDDSKENAQIVPEARQMPHTTVPSPKQGHPVVMMTRLGRKVQRFCTTVITRFGGQVVSDFCSDVTHLVVATDQRNAITKDSYTFKYLMALVCGVWIVNVKWVFQSHKSNTLQNEDMYEVKGDPAFNQEDVPRSYRLRKQRKHNGLFKGFRFCLIGRFQESQISKEQLMKLLDKLQADATCSIHEMDCSSSQINTVVVTTDNTENLNQKEIDVIRNYGDKIYHPDWIVESIINGRIESPGDMMYKISS